MILLYLLEPLVIALIALVVISQILVPTVQGGRWFPLFRRADVHKTHLRMEEERARIEEQLETERLRLEVEALRDDLLTQSQTHHTRSNDGQQTQADPTTKEHP